MTPKSLSRLRDEQQIFLGKDDDKVVVTVGYIREIRFRAMMEVCDFLKNIQDDAGWYYANKIESHFLKSQDKE